MNVTDEMKGNKFYFANKKNGTSKKAKFDKQEMQNPFNSLKITNQALELRIDEKVEINIVPCCLLNDKRS